MMRGKPVLRLRTTGHPVEIIWVPQYIDPQNLADEVVIVGSLQCFGWRRQKFLHELTDWTFDQEETRRQIKACLVKLWGGQTFPNLAKVAARARRPIKEFTFP